MEGDDDIDKELERVLNEKESNVKPDDLFGSDSDEDDESGDEMASK